MRLEFVEIRDFRSIFADDGGQPFRLDLAAGATAARQIELGLLHTEL